MNTNFRYRVILFKIVKLFLKYWKHFDGIMELCFPDFMSFVPIPSKNFLINFDF